MWTKLGYGGLINACLVKCGPHKNLFLFLRNRFNFTLAMFQNEVSHEEYCSACKHGANLQPCGTCSRAYHLSCLDPPLKSVPKGAWVCPKCQEKVSGCYLLETRKSASKMGCFHLEPMKT
uniref:PHD-type domain-containing protein n=1 Tax=Pseudonaja textilis TaxID=8673 RepID=A0A670XX89_PSETE